MAHVVLKDPDTGETITTLNPENYPETFEVLGIEEEPKDGEVWGDNGWEKPEGLDDEIALKEMNRLPKAVRALLMRQEARIYMLEQAVFELQSQT